MNLFLEGNALYLLCASTPALCRDIGPNQPGDVDRMPVFAGCEAFMETEKAQEECTQKLVEFMSSKLGDPEDTGG